MVEHGDLPQLLLRERTVPATFEDATDATCGGPDDIEHDVLRSHCI